MQAEPYSSQPRCGSRSASRSSRAGADPLMAAAEIVAPMVLGHATTAPSSRPADANATSIFSRPHSGTMGTLKMAPNALQAYPLPRPLKWLVAWPNSGKAATLIDRIREAEERKGRLAEIEATRLGEHDAERLEEQIRYKHAQAVPRLSKPSIFSVIKEVGNHGGTRKDDEQPQLPSPAQIHCVESADHGSKDGPQTAPTAQTSMWDATPTPTLMSKRLRVPVSSSEEPKKLVQKHMATNVEAFSTNDAMRLKMVNTVMLGILEARDGKRIDSQARIAITGEEIEEDGGEGPLTD
ncbi:hypothetical protein L1887_49827 [Cichorium endivia]|nr:hypothetical protein L1887_49827 [Cichorium endivia]